MNKKYLRLMLLMIVASVFLTACASSADEVSLATRTTMVRWCEKEFLGEVTVMSAEKGENEVTYVMQDNEKGFAYHAKTYATSSGMDGSTLWWHEEKYSDFQAVYRSYFVEQYSEQIKEIETKYNVKISFDPYIYLARMVGDDTEAVVNAANEFLLFVIEYDTRGFWKETSTLLYSGDEYVGYVNEAETYVDAETEYVQWMLACAADEMNVSKKRLEFVSTETRSVNDIAGYNPDKLAHVLGSDNDTKHESVVIYFKYNHDNYWICDLVVVEDETGRLVHLGNHLIE